MSGLTTIKLSGEDLKKEQERQRKRGRLVFKTLKKGKVKVKVGWNDPDGTVPDMIFQYHIHDAYIRSVVDYTNGEVICVMDCLYDDIDIFNEDGSEITEKLPLWLVSEIENKIEDKFDQFNIELRFMRQSDGEGKKHVVNESKEEDQKTINKVRVLYKAYRNGNHKFKYRDHPHKVVSWVLPSKFSVKIKHYSQEDSERYGYEDYPIITLNTETIEYTTDNGEPISNGENMVLTGVISGQFRKHGITLYWSARPTPEDYTNVDITPKSK